METISIPGIAEPASRVCLGTWAIGGWMWGGADDDASVKTIRAAYDQGVTIYDTAPVYGFGHSEEVVGRAVAPFRDEVLIATKCGLGWGADERPFRDSRPDSIRREVDAALRRLGTDRIDLYQVHWPDPRVPFAETGAALDEIRQAGKIRAIGVSNFAPGEMDALATAVPLATDQPPYNLFERGIDDDVVTYADDHGIVLLAYGALCRGLLSGRMRPGTTFEGDDLRVYDPKFQQPRYGQYLAAVEALSEIARARGKSVLALAVRWVLDRGPTIALWGARTPSQLDAVGDVTGWRLTDDDMRAIDDALARTVTDPVGPEFMAPPARDA